LEFLGRQPGECQKFPSIRFDLGIRQHAQSLFLIPNNVYCSLFTVY